ncbi:MAG: class I SAM-dependent methyltransferase [Rhodospirillales bacterium]
MPLNGTLFDTAAELYAPGMGAEHVAPLLYSLVRMLRPHRVLEVGLGYTSPFLAQALADNRAEFDDDKEILDGRRDDAERRAVLVPDYYEQDYEPRLVAIDDLSLAGSTAPKVREVLHRLELDGYVDFHNGDFRGFSKNIAPENLPFDFVWFDCGGPFEYIDFLNEYWPLINDNHGILLMHFTYWYGDVADADTGAAYRAHFLSPIANEIKRQQLMHGYDSEFEVLSLLEPHKNRQGSVTMVRKLTVHSLCRDEDFQEAMAQITGRAVAPIPKL